MNSKNLLTGAAILALSSALSLAQAQNSFGVTVNLNSGITLQNTYFAYDTDYGVNAPTVVDEGTVTSGELLTGTSGTAFTSSDNYTMIGDYLDNAGAEHLVIDLNGTGAAITNGQPFDSTIGALTGVSEADVLGYLTEGDAIMTEYIQEGWVNAHPYEPAVGTSGTLMGFSNGAPVGSTAPAPAPEPASMAALALGAIVLVKRRRRA